jgi:NAD(P)H-nitrite reductase large subunit
MTASTGQHHVIIGSGSAGFAAAKTIRERDATARISLVTLSSLPFYNRYDLTQMFKGETDWRKLLAVPPRIYDDLGITLRRGSRVVSVDGKERTIAFAHNEVMRFDKLLVASGGGGYVPEVLAELKPLLHGFGSYEQANATVAALPQGATAVIIGGDMLGIDLASTLAETGRKVVLVVNEFTFWPHRVAGEQRDKLQAALGQRGIRVINGPAVTGIEAAAGGRMRFVRLDDGNALEADAVLAFCGLSPLVEFMLGAGVDIERGLLVNPELRTNNEAIWAAGDVCQIWSDADKEYKFYHGWKNVRVMGELAARNMTGGHETFVAGEDAGIRLEEGRLQSSFWEH